MSGNLGEDGAYTYGVNITPAVGFDSVAIVNVPDGVELNEGHLLPNGIWMLWPNQLDSLEMYVPSDIANNTQLNPGIKVIAMHGGNAKEIEFVKFHSIVKSPNASEADTAVEPILESDFDSSHLGYEAAADSFASTTDNSEFLNYELSTGEQMTFNEMLGNPDEVQISLTEDVIFGDDIPIMDESSLIFAQNDEASTYPWEAERIGDSKLSLDQTLMAEENFETSNDWGGEDQLHYTAEDIVEAHDLLANNDEIFETESHTSSPIDSKPIEGM